DPGDHGGANGSRPRPTATGCKPPPCEAGPAAAGAGADDGRVTVALLLPGGVRLAGVGGAGAAPGAGARPGPAAHRLPLRLRRRPRLLLAGAAMAARRRRPHVLHLGLPRHLLGPLLSAGDLAGAT